MDMINILTMAIQEAASDIFIIAGLPVSYKKNGRINPVSEEKLMPMDTEILINEIYSVANKRTLLESGKGDDDFSLSIPNIGRFRVSVFKQRGSMAAIIRVVLFTLPDVDELGIPKAVMDFSKLKKGLVLVTGPAGSGKSTTLSCIVDEINKTRNCHIMTLEDPIEYIHKHNKSVVCQREISIDTESYAEALRSSLRQSPDVILVGEMRDLETISTAITAAETGHLVLSTLHTLGASNTVDRIIDVFPSNQQQQVRVQLSMVLQGVVSQQLIPSPIKGRVGAFEIMMANPAIRNLIREGKVQQIESVLFSNGGMGMQTMDSSIFKLYQGGLISSEDAILYAVNVEKMGRLIKA